MGTPSHGQTLAGPEKREEYCRVTHRNRKRGEHGDSTDMVLTFNVNCKSGYEQQSQLKSLLSLNVLSKLACEKHTALNRHANNFLAS